MAELGFEESLWNQVCFHSHQAAEKSLKAFFAYEGNLPPRTHRLTNLSKSLEDRYPSLRGSSDDLLVLENYYIPSRYPDVKTLKERSRRRREFRSLSNRRFGPTVR